MTLTRRLIAATCASALLALAACGGGGGEAPAASPSEAQGLWGGTSTPAGPEQRSVFGIVTGDGRGYLFYSVPGSTAQRGGLVQGKVTTNGSAFSFADARDYNFEGAGIGTVSVAGDFAAAGGLNARIDYPSGARTSYAMQAGGSYERAPQLSLLLSTFRGEVLMPGGGVPSFDISVATDGGISGGGSSACAVSGSVTPRTDGNVFDVTIIFGPSPCIRPLQTFTGVAVYNIGTTEITVGAVNAARSDALVYLARKR